MALMDAAVAEHPHLHQTEYIDHLEHMERTAREVHQEDAEAEESLLRQLPVNERLSVEKEAQALERWKERRKDWQRVRNNVSSRTLKPSHTLMMSQADGYREVAETYDMLQAARPSHERFGSVSWEMGLRGGGPRYVGVGNAFSGLYCAVKDSLPVPDAVRRPDSEGARFSVTQTNRSWQKSVSMTEAQNKYKKRIQSLRPYQSSGADNTEALLIQAQPLFEWARQSAQEHFDFIEEQRADWGSTSSVGQENALRRESEIIEEEPTREEVAAEEAKRQEEALTTAPPQRRGPHLQLLTSKESVLRTEPEQLAFHTVRVRNVGSSVLFFEWAPVPARDTIASKRRADAVDSLRERQLTSPSTGRPMVFCHRTTGCMLPGAEQTFTFSFRARVPGMFSHEWRLSTKPVAKLFGTNSITAPVVFTLRSLAASPDVWAHRRAALTSRIQDRVDATRAEQARKMEEETRRKGDEARRLEEELASRDLGPRNCARVPRVQPDDVAGKAALVHVDSTLDPADKHDLQHVLRCVVSTLALGPRMVVVAVTPRHNSGGAKAGNSTKAFVEAMQPLIAGHPCTYVRSVPHIYAELEYAEQQAAKEAKKREKALKQSQKKGGNGVEVPEIPIQLAPIFVLEQCWSTGLVPALPEMPQEVSDDEDERIPLGEKFIPPLVERQAVPQDVEIKLKGRKGAKPTSVQCPSHIGPALSALVEVFVEEGDVSLTDEEYRGEILQRVTVPVRLGPENTHELIAGAQLFMSGDELESVGIPDEVRLPEPTPPPSPREDADGADAAAPADEESVQAAPPARRVAIVGGSTPLAQRAACVEHLLRSGMQVHITGKLVVPFLHAIGTLGMGLDPETSGCKTADEFAEANGVSPEDTAAARTLLELGGPNHEENGCGSLVLPDDVVFGDLAIDEGALAAATSDPSTGVQDYDGEVVVCEVLHELPPKEEDEAEGDAADSKDGGSKKEGDAEDEDGEEEEEEDEDEEEEEEEEEGGFRFVYDIGPATVSRITESIAQARTVVCFGSVGRLEYEAFQESSVKVLMACRARQLQEPETSADADADPAGAAKESVSAAQPAVPGRVARVFLVGDSLVRWGRVLMEDLIEVDDEDEDEDEEEEEEEEDDDEEDDEEGGGETKNVGAEEEKDAAAEEEERRRQKQLKAEADALKATTRAVSGMAVDLMHQLAVSSVSASGSSLLASCVHGRFADGALDFSEGPYLVKPTPPAEDAAATDEAAAEEEEKVDAADSEAAAT